MDLLYQELHQCRNNDLKHVLYLHKKRQAITKAIKKQKSEGIGGVVNIPALGDFVKGK